MSTDFLIFFDYVDFQIVKIDVFHKAVLCETGFVVLLKFFYGRIQPDRLSQIKLIADLVQRMKDLVGTGVRTVVLNDGITQHMVIFKNLCPESKHFILHSADVFSHHSRKRKACHFGKFCRVCIQTEKSMIYWCGVKN